MSEQDHCVDLSSSEACQALKVGSFFESFQTLVSAIQRLEVETYQSFSIESCKRFPPNEKKFLFVKLVLVCKNGIRCRPRGEGLRPNQSYFGALRCSCRIHIHFNNSENKLKVTVSNFNHNHEISAELLSHFPHKRRLDKDSKDFIVRAAQLGASIKLIAEEVRSTDNKNVTTRDIRNVIDKAHNSDARNDVLKTISILENVKKTDPDAYLKVLSDSRTNAIDLIFFQSSLMHRWFLEFPELIEVDGTYRLNNINYVLYLFTALDKNRISRVVAAAFLSSETEYLVTSCFEQFKICNGSTVDKTKIVVLDKDFESVKAAQDTFPGATILLCMVHVERNFQKIVREMKFTPEETSEIAKNCLSIQNIKERTLSLLKRLLHSRQHDLFEETCTEILSDKLIPSYFKEIFTSNWLSCKEMWAYVSRKKLLTFGIKDTNQIEAQNKHIKDVIRPYSKMSLCVQNLLKFLSMHTFNVKHREYLGKCKGKIQISGSDDEQKSFLRQNFTDFASTKLISEYERFEKEFTQMDFVESGSSVTVSKKTSNSNHSVEENRKCSCDFFCQFELPCHHILAVRSLKKLNLFDLNLISTRFRKVHGNSVVVLPNPTSNHHSVTKYSSDSERSKFTPGNSVLTVNEKYNKMLTLAKRICDTCSKLSFTEFELRFSQLDNFLNMVNGADKTDIDIGKMLSTDNITHLKKDSSQLVEHQETSSFLNSSNNLNLNTSLLHEEKVEVVSTANDSVGSFSQVKNESFHELLTFRRQRKVVGNVKGLNEKQRSFRKKQINHLKLSDIEITNISSSEFLQDCVLNKAAHLIRLTFNTECPAPINKNMRKQDGSFVQIFKFNGTYITVHSENHEKVKLYCARTLILSHSELPENPFLPLFRQITAMLSIKNKFLKKVEFVVCPITESSCAREQALIAIASAVDLCRGADPTSKVYKLGAHISQHMMNCFENGQVVSFPSSRNFMKAKPNSLHVTVHCICKVSYVKGENMICCDNCDVWYHPKCIALEESHPAFDATKNPWVCRICESDFKEEPEKKRMKSIELYHNTDVTENNILTLPAFTWGGSIMLGKEKITFLNTCTIDSCLMPLHAYNFENNGKLSQLLGVSHDASLHQLGRVLDLATQGKVLEAKLSWSNFIGLQPKRGLVDFHGDLEQFFVKFFRENIRSHMSTICSNHVCPYPFHEKTDFGICLNISLDTKIKTLQGAIDNWCHPPAEKCDTYSIDDTGTVDITKSCDGIRTFSERKLLCNLPKIIMINLQCLYLNHRGIPDFLTIFGRCFKYIGAVYHTGKDHFVSSFKFRNLDYFYDDMGGGTFSPNPWKYRVSLAFFVQD